jgi:alkylhydroperoxidase family enzyme
MFIEIPEGEHPINYVWGKLVPGIGVAASKFAGAVYTDSTLELETFEAARIRMAQINGCIFCLDWRTERDGIKVDAEFDSHVLNWQNEVETGTSPLPLRAQLAAEYSERWALNHHEIDEALWTRLRAQFSDQELVELTMCLGSWLSFGRLNHVFGLDSACMLPAQ